MSWKTLNDSSLPIILQVRKAIHVGDLKYDDVSEKVHDKLYDDMPKTVRPWLEDLLNNDYKAC